MLRRLTIQRAAALALALGLALGGCDATAPSQAPTPAPTPAPRTPGPTAPPAAPTGTPRPPAEVYAEIRAAVEAIRGLEPSSAVDPVTIDETQLRANLEDEFDAALTPAQLKDTEDLLITLGLLPKGTSLRAATLDLQSGQVAGYYSPEKDELFVVNRTDGRIGPVDEATYAHEFTHQLQDQHFDLDKLDLSATDESDRSLGRLALVEGDATSAQGTWMTTNLDAKELGELLSAAMDPESLAALQRAPRYLRDTALFPYQDGLGFVTRLLANGGYAAVDAAFADPPESTEQILHPDKYLQRERPIDVTLPKVLFDGLGPGWIEVGQDTLGELLLRIWLNEGGIGTAASLAATDGWGGDRLALLRNGEASSVLLQTEWDTVGDAAEFATAVTTAIAKLAPGGTVVQQPGSRIVWVGIGEGAKAIVAFVTFVAQ